MKKIFLGVFVVLGLNSSLWAMGSRPSNVPKGTKAESKVKLSLTLEDCYQMSVRQSEALALRKEEVRRTMASFLQASGVAIGDVNYVSTDFHQDSSGSGGGGSSIASTYTAAERRERKFTFSQPLFQGFQAIGALSGAGSLKKQRVGEWERAKQLLFLDVVGAFYDYLRLNQDVEIIEGILSLYEERLKELKGWEENGRSRPSESATAQSHFESFRGELAKSKGARATARNFLTFLIGIEVEKDELREEAISMPSEESLDFFELAHRRPDVQAAKQAIKTARGGLIVAQSGLWPKLSVDSSLYEKREGFQSGISWDALLTLTVPLGKGGTTLGNVRDSYSEWKEAKLTYSLTEKRARREIKDAYDHWKNSSDRYKALNKAVRASQENFTLQKGEYQRQLVSNLDVLESMQSLFQAKRDGNQAFYDVRAAYWQLEVAKGNCCKEASTKYEWSK